MIYPGALVGVARSYKDLEYNEVIDLELFPWAFAEHHKDIKDYEINRYITLTYSVLKKMAEMDVNPPGTTPENKLAREYLKYSAQSLLSAKTQIDEDHDVVIFDLSNGPIPQ